MVAALIVLLATVSLGSIAASFDRGGRFVYLPVLGCAVLAASVSIGLWKLSSRNPALTASPQSGVSDCVVARITLAISMLGLAVSLAIGFASGFGSMPAGIAMLASPYGISGGVFFYSMARVIEKLAVLAEDKFAIGRVRQYRIGFVISWCPFWGTLLTLPVAPGPVVCVTLLAATCALMFAVLIVCSPAYLSESLKAARAYADAVTQDPETALGQVECVDD
ncbi:MAG: hypothetical protein HZB38_13250 [Planctomycetes bacterium]|nr:hypothetical protein [Planctomycetota bacterium]